MCCAQRRRTVEPISGLHTSPQRRTATRCLSSHLCWTSCVLTTQSAMECRTIIWCLPTRVNLSSKLPFTCSVPLWKALSPLCHRLRSLRALPTSSQPMRFSPPSYYEYWLITGYPVWGRGTPLPPCPFTSLSFPLFTFPFLSLALPIFFFCPSLPFLPE